MSLRNVKATKGVGSNDEVRSGRGSGREEPAFEPEGSIPHSSRRRQRRISERSEQARRVERGAHPRIRGPRIRGQTVNYNYQVTADRSRMIVARRASASGGTRDFARFRAALTACELIPP